MVAAVKKGVSSGTRVSIGLFVALALAIFMLLWDAQIISAPGAYATLGPVVILPLLAITLGFIADSIIQYFSCGKVQWSSLWKKSLTYPVPFWCLYVFLYVFPIMRWPVEGLVQSTTPLIRRGLSSAFYTFWIALYTQSVHTSLAQLC